MDQVRQPESLLVCSWSEMLPASWHPALGIKTDSRQAGPGSGLQRPALQLRILYPSQACQPPQPQAVSGK